MTKEFIARTGRVQSWIDDPTSRLPVSCTVFVVEDSMEGPNGIEASHGDSSPTPCDTEQELPSTSANCELQAPTMAKGLLPLVLVRSGKSILL